MTKIEFLSEMPDIIYHKTWGYAELEIVIDSDEQKGICYRHRDETASYGTYKKTWRKLYNDLRVFLKEQGHI